MFFTFFLLFARFFPVLALNEIKSILKSSGESYKNAPDTHHVNHAEHAVKDEHTIAPEPTTPDASSDHSDTGEDHDETNDETTNS